MAKFTMDDAARLALRVRELEAEVGRLYDLDVERREAHAFLTGKFETGWCLTHTAGRPDTELGRAAAEAVSERDRLRRQLQAVEIAFADLGFDTEAWKHLDLVRRAWVASRDYTKSLEGEVATLRNALRPFAAFAREMDRLGPHLGDNYEIEGGSWRGGGVCIDPPTIGDCRHARAVLNDT